MARDMGGVGALLTPEMQGIMQRDCDKLRAEGKINRLENIAVRSAEVTEAWQERDRGAPPSQADLKPGGYGQVALQIVVGRPRHPE